MEYVRVTTTINAPIEQVWAIIAGFGTLKLWGPSIKSCALDGEGIASIRTVHLADALPEPLRAAPQRERLDEIDANSCRISYTLLEPSLLPLRNVRSTMQLVSHGSASTELVWWSTADDEPAASDEVRALIAGFYSECAAKLKLLLET